MYSSSIVELVAARIFLFVFAMMSGGGWAASYIRSCIVSHAHLDSPWDELRSVPKAVPIG